MRKQIFYSLVVSFLYLSTLAQNDLNYYIDAAKVNSPLVVDAKNQLAANKLELERIKAFYTKPQVTFNAGLALSPILNRDNGSTQLQISPSDATNYSGYDIAASNGGVYQAMVNVNQPLFNASKLRLASEQVGITTLINQNSVKITEHDLEKIIGDQYVICLQDLKQKNYSEQLNQLILEQYLVVNKLVESGLLKQSDLLLVAIEKQTQLNTLSATKSTYRRDLMDLNILCGINDTSLVIIKDLDLSLKSDVSQSGFAEKYRLDSLNLVATQHLFELKYKPQLNTFANAGLNGVYVPTLPNRLGVSAGLNFSVYLFDGKQKNINRKKTDLLIHSTQSYKANFVTQNTVRKTKIVNEINALNERIAVSANQINDYKQLLDYYKKEVVTGQQSVTLYINTVKNFAILQRDYVLMQTNKQLLINTYNYWNW